jgi:nitrate reductase NapAB chaperone NapD
MHLSGLLVICEPSSTEDCVRHLERCSDIDVYVTDHAVGRVVVVLETKTLDEQTDGLRRVQRLPHVKSAELVYHYFGDAGEAPADPSEWLTRRDGGGVSDRSSNHDLLDETTS